MREASKWKVISLPMIAEENDPIGRRPGERLWPDWFTDEMVEDAKRDARCWNALYQQNPVPEEGNFFKKEWFIEYSDGELPSTLHKYGTSDFAVTDKGGDFTEHAFWGVDFGGDLWLLDWWYGQTSPDVWIEKLCDMIGQHKPMTWFGEAGPIRRSVEPFMRKRMDARHAYCNFEWLPSIMDKATRARPFQAMASMGKVKIPKDKPFMGHVISQWLQFPAGRNDDAVDAALSNRKRFGVHKVCHPKKTLELAEFGDSVKMAASLHSDFNKIDEKLAKIDLSIASLRELVIQLASLERGIDKGLAVKPTRAEYGKREVSREERTAKSGD